MNFIEKLFILIDKYYVVRRLLLVLVSYMCFDAYQWAKNLVMIKQTPGAELGLIIAAVTFPISLLLKELVAMYNDMRNSKDVSTK